MGYSAEATFGFGVKISLIDLINQINKDNFAKIMDFLEKSTVDEENEDFNYSQNDLNEYFCELVQKMKPINEDGSEKYILPKKIIINDNQANEIKEKLLSHIETMEHYFYGKYDNKKTYTGEFKFKSVNLLKIVENVISCERWGYNRVGSNGVSMDICNFNEKLQKVKIEWLKDYEIVMIQKLNGG